MGQEARQQPRAGYDDQAQPLKKCEGVHLKPVLRDPSIDEAVELKAGKRNLSVCRREPLELARVGACEVDALCDKVAFAHSVLDGELKVRESDSLRAKRN
jgi:hypothetical protein